MQFRQFGTRYILRLDIGEEIVETLKRFCAEHNITLGTIHALGATNKAKIGLYDVKAKQYLAKEFNQDFEIAPLFGIITTKEGEIYLHIHANLADAEHRSFGGHLNYAVVSATCEAVIEKMDGAVGRKLDDVIGLNLIEF